MNENGPWEVLVPFDKEEVEIRYHIGFWETQSVCYSALPWHTSVLAFVFNPIVQVACSKWYVPDLSDPHPECDIYMIADIPALREHEEEHCRGILDDLY